MVLVDFIEDRALPDNVREDPFLEEGSPVLVYIRLLVRGNVESYARTSEPSFFFMSSSRS